MYTIAWIIKWLFYIIVLSVPAGLLSIFIKYAMDFQELIKNIP